MYSIRSGMALLHQVKVWFSKSSLFVEGSAGVAGSKTLTEDRLGRQEKWVYRVVGLVHNTARFIFREVS